MPRSDFDVVVVGAGLDGLVAAATLARSRVRVLVVERRSVVGGAAAPVPIPGVDGATACVAMPTVGLFRRRIFDELRLGRRGVRIVSPDPLFWTPLPGGRSLAIRSDPSHTAAELRTLSTSDGAVYARFALWRQSLVRRLEPWLGAAAPGHERLARAAGKDGALRDLLFGSIGEVARRHFDTPALHATLAVQATSGTTLGPDDPGTFFHYVYRHGGDLFAPRSGFGQVTGGAFRLALALEEAAVEAGATVRCGAEVVSLDLQRGRLRGVVLADRSLVTARVVLSSLSQRTTLLRLVPGGVLPTRTRAGIEARRAEGTTFRLALALDGLPTLAVARPSPGGSAAFAGILSTASSLEEVSAAHADARAGRAASRPVVEVTFPTVLDPTLAPPGVHLALATAHHAPRTLVGTSWEAERDTFAARVIAVLEEIAPDLRARVRAEVALSPADLEETLGSEGGHPAQGDVVPGAIGVDRPTQTPVPGLFLCGAGAHPGGPGTGLAGRLAAHAARRYLRRK